MTFAIFHWSGKLRVINFVKYVKFFWTFLLAINNRFTAISSYEVQQVCISQ